MNQSDPELRAMALIADAIQDLEPAARVRVLAWARGRFTDKEAAKETPEPQSPSANLGLSDFPTLFDAADPGTEVDRALTGAYWLQVLQEGGDFDSQNVNTLLKNMGHGISNITKSLSRAEAMRPALVRQVHKAGKLKQSRKKFRLTVEGIRHVEGLIDHARS